MMNLGSQTEERDGVPTSSGNRTANLLAPSNSTHSSSMCPQFHHRSPWAPYIEDLNVRGIGMESGKVIGIVRIEGESQ